MNTKKIITVLLLVGALSSLSAQFVIKSDAQVKQIRELPQETTFVHYNATTLFAGEYLYYQIDCFNNETRKLSDFSKIAYVALINENKEEVFRHKIRLKDGVGYGDFFIPVTVPSGSYKVVGYTRWTLNTPNTFFQGDLGIINPYLGDQKVILKNENLNVKTDDVSEAMNRSSSDLKLSLSNNKSYAKRTQVSFYLTSTNNKVKNGQYAISVRKLDAIPVLKANNTATVLNESSLQPRIGQEWILPELRGELITGVISAKNTNASLENNSVSLSIPGEQYQLEIASTDSNGRFFFNMEQEYDGNEAIVQLLDTTDDYSIRLEEVGRPNYDIVQFKKFTIDRSLKNAIEQRSVYNQIENGYFEKKPDSVIVGPPVAPFYEGNVERYDLDAYSRFKTIKETLVEVVDNAWVERDEAFKVRGPIDDVQTDLPPLVIADGLLIKDHTNLLAYDARRIKYINLIRDKYIYGAKLYQGILAFETEEGDYNGGSSFSNILTEQLFKPQQSKKYFKQIYTADSNQRIPDYRSQLLWLPNVKLKEQQQFDFYTSDNTGTYLITISGFTEGGAPVSISNTFKVE
ncbi:hypothetical protein [Spongiivirga citrea]|uniref:Macroglobulin domain-containing protein n=1 Tax=Spongiivirga citrea TaxID=1481457 RepID=A0A6M0CF25_9FLAO|nr:hypothetical protein [Spongiivirga citrea]NER16371.1 hypothetical protein [Spongiivirga citrea]